MADSPSLVRKCRFIPKTAIIRPLMAFINNFESPKEAASYDGMGRRNLIGIHLA